MPYQRRNRSRFVGGASGRGWTFVLLTALMFGHTSCKRSETEQAAPDAARAANAEDSTPSRKAGEPAPVAKVSDTPPIPVSIMGYIVRKTALVQIPGEPERAGILLKGAASSSTRNYLVICNAPAELESVCVAYQSSGKTGKALAKRISILPSGLSLYGFTTKSLLTCYRPAAAKTGDTIHAIRLEGEGSLSPEEQVAMTAELETIRNRLNELSKQDHESMRAASRRQPRPGTTRRIPQDPRQRLNDQRELHRVRANIRSEMDVISLRQSEIRAHLKFPVAGIAGVEVAAATERDELEVVGDSLANTLLVTKQQVIVALRHQGKWLNIADILTSSGNLIEKVQFELSGSKNIVQLSCKFFPTLPSAENQYSMVAATTYELESKGSGSIEERLASMKPVPFHARGSYMSVSHQLKWNGSKTKLWLRVFNNQHPDKPILNEVIQLDYPGSFRPRWDKPPSPLITIPEPKPNTPEDLVNGLKTLDAKGEIRDIVAAGDGSVVMVRTNQPPFWAPLDMKTGQWMAAPWKATAETLLAAQAGKVYLVDAKTGMLEIWGVASGKREGLQLLPFADRVVSVAAPLSDPAQPLMIATVKGCYFLDPVKFEVIPSNLNLGGYFDQDTAKRSSRSPLLDSASLCLRASGDGSLYTFSGISTNTERRSPTTVTLTVDRSAMVVSKISGMQFVASRGRHITNRYPDHGGSATSIMPVSTNARFPAPMGEIRFMNNSGRDAIAVMASSPVFPTKAGDFNGSLMLDRGTYFDSSLGVLLLPDGDKLHLVQLDFPEQEKPLPKFIFAGEALEIPLPAGSGHKLTSKDGGTSEIGLSSARWVAPVGNYSNRQYSLKLEWTGELGSQIYKDYRIQVLPLVGSPEVLLPNGRKSIALNRRVILNEVDSDIAGFAGSGTVVLYKESGSFSAWNLFTGELILRKKVNSTRILGDADRIYVLEREGQLTSFDILTGQELGRANIGKKIRSIATGMSSRDALLAVEQEGVDGFLIQIPRDSLKPLIIDLPTETRRKLFMPEMVANASGSAIWSRQVAVFRDSRAITVTSIPYQMSDRPSHGVPDATGKIIVGRRAILNLAGSAPKSLPFSQLTGLGDSPQGRLDQSGRYLLFSDPKEDPLWRYISLRDVRKPSQEMMKIRYPSTENLGLPYMISGTNTLLQFQRVGGRLNAVVYELNIPELIKELSH